MKNRIIALVVVMILLLSSSLFAQAPNTLWKKTLVGTNKGSRGSRNWYLNFDVGRYWLYLQNRWSTAYKVSYPSFPPFYFIYRIRYAKHDANYVELGLSKGQFSISANYKSWESELIEEEIEEGLITLMNQNLDVNSISVKGAYYYYFIEKYASVSLIMGGGIGWGAFSRGMFGLRGEVEGYRCQPILCTGTGVNIGIERKFFIYCTGEYEMLHFKGNPSFILDNWTIKSGLRLIM